MACGTAYACHWEPSVRATAQAPVHVEYMCAFGAFPHAFWTVGVIEGLHSPSTGNGTGLRYRIWMSFRAVGKSNRASTRAWCVHVCAVHFDPFPHELASRPAAGPSRTGPGRCQVWQGWRRRHGESGHGISAKTRQAARCPHAQSTQANQDGSSANSTRVMSIACPWIKKEKP